MPRPSKGIDPSDGPVARFAIELRALRDAAGPAAPDIPAIASSEGVAESTLYAALSGTRLPSRDIVAVLAAKWDGDQAAWMARRTQAENERSLSRAGFLQAEQDETAGIDLAETPALVKMRLPDGEFAQLQAGLKLPERNSAARREAFARLLRAAVSQSGGSSKDVATITRSSRSAISRWMTGRSIPRREVLAELVAALGLEDELDLWTDAARWAATSYE